MKRRASGEITENEVTLSKPKETGRSGRRESQASFPEEDSIRLEITEQLLSDLRRSHPHDGIYSNSDVNPASYYHNVDSSTFVSGEPYLAYPHLNDANSQGQELGFEHYSVQQTCEDGSQRISNYRHMFQATASQASTTTLVAPTPDAVYFYGPQIPQVQHTTYNCVDGSANYQPGPVFSPQRTEYQDDEFDFSYMEFLNSGGILMMPEDTPASEATPVPKAIPVPEVIHTAKPPKTQKRKEKKEGGAPPAVNVNDNDNNPAPATRDGRWCPWPGCKRKTPFSKGHNLLQHRRDVHKEDIPILKYRFGCPPPNDPSRRMQQHGRRGVETATGEK
ncbi:hypothetical protein DFP73DRAFT_528982 [Morchella snyderi]|nr:hypothetical protein DFP73DRAFT_528982 [Morchella snyderi]